MNICSTILQTGPRRGYPCGKRACRRHEQDLLCEYGMTYEDIIGEENVKKLNGYINVRVGDISLVLMSKVLNQEHFTKATLASEINVAVEYMRSKPDVYDSNVFNHFVLRSITYDSLRGLYIAHKTLIS